MRHVVLRSLLAAAAFSLAACSHSGAGAGGVVPAFAGPAARAAAAATILHDFGKGYDAAYPQSELVNVGGIFYGTSSEGGKYQQGTVFSIDPQGHEKVLHSFAGGKDGAGPFSGLVFAGGKLYGTTENGGAGGFGTVFSITPGGQEKVLYAFAGQPNDGAGPAATLTYLKGVLYGTTMYGGANQNLGTLFSITLDGKERVLHQFGKGTDGNTPSAQLVAVGGMLYGTTAFAATNQGSLFKMSPAGKYAILHQFDYEGERPNGLVYAGGKLYGITAGAPNAVGTFYSATLTGHVTTLYQFLGDSGTDVTHPYGTIAYAAGYCYFTGASGGAYGQGGVVKISTAGKERVAYSFGAGGKNDGAQPSSGPVLYGGNLYGVTREGGTNPFNGFGGGTAYKLRP